MKLQTLQILHIFIECRIIVGGASVWVCEFCVVWHVWVCVVGEGVCMCRVLCVCVEMVVRVCLVYVRFVFWCCGVLCCVITCGVGAQCVVCGVCGVCVCGAAWHAENAPCVGSERFRVYWQNARMCSTCARFASTHGSVLNVHTETF